MNSGNSPAQKTNSTAAALLTEMLSDPNGQFSPSIYETGRLVTLAPSLDGHRRRVRFLLAEQQPDGGWGGPEGYGLVPTLSATEALLNTLRQPEPGLPPDELPDAIERGLHALVAGLREHELPDTVAIEIIIPGLIADINAHLDALEANPPSPLTRWPHGHRLPLPPGLHDDLLAKLRDAVRAGHPLPSKLLHSLEVIGPVAQGAAFATPLRGNVGCSPAATATWLGNAAIQENQDPSVRYLRNVQDDAGAVPVAAPLALFERAWVLSTLTGAGIDVPTDDGLWDSVRTAIDESGAGGGHGLPADADDTSSALYTLALLGDPQPPDCLWRFHEGAHFSTFPDERTPSTTTNAHVLEAFGASLTLESPNRARYRETIGALTGWLCDQQLADGSWWDKWHASPYYATKCCARALENFGGTAAHDTVRKAVDWLLASQREDGSWGRWSGTYEETAYAVQILAHTRIPREDGAIEHAAARGCEFLRHGYDVREHPPLWHDKDLYTPVRIVRVEILAALHLAAENPRVAALVTGWDGGEIPPGSR